MTRDVGKPEHDDLPSPSSEATDPSSVAGEARRALYQRSATSDTVKEYLALVGGTPASAVAEATTPPTIEHEEERQSSRRRRVHRLWFLVPTAALIVLGLVAQAMRPARHEHPSRSPGHALVAIPTRTMPLANSERQALLTLLRERATSAGSIGKLVQGDIDQTADTADTLLANGVLGDVPQPAQTQQGLSNHIGAHGSAKGLARTCKL